ncbi:MAG TPA: branched-chain amino acid ABC transporter permease [Candidatus Methylomirabilis sp.]|nr:branched-chain amino acid ABC transporter permease [Candidatus Methylomirabilis sp.]
MKAPPAPAGRRRWAGAAGVLGLLALLLIPLTEPQGNLIRLLLVTLLWVTTSLAWNLLGGVTGQVSFGFAVFYGLGAYASAFAINAGINPYVAFVAGGLSAAVGSILVGIPAFRLRGPYFAIATIGVNEAVRIVMSNLEVTGGASGYRLIASLRYSQEENYYTALGLATLAFLVSWHVMRSPFGLALRAIREDEDAAADVGVPPFGCKLAVHALAAFLTGMAGGAFARYTAYIHPEGVFAFATSVSILLMPVIGGLGTLLGPLIGAVVYSIVQEEMVVHFPQFHLLLYGSLLIVIVLFEPGGLVGLGRRLARRIGGEPRGTAEPPKARETPLAGAAP